MNQHKFNDISFDYHKHAIDALCLLDECRRRISLILEFRASVLSLPPYPKIADLDASLGSCELLLHDYLSKLFLQHEDRTSDSEPDIMDNRINSNHRGGVEYRSQEDALLFKLTVNLQLCILRLEDADRNLCGKKAAKKHSQNFHDDEYSCYLKSDNDWKITITDDSNRKTKIESAIKYWIQQRSSRKMKKHARTNNTSNNIDETNIRDSWFSKRTKAIIYTGVCGMMIGSYYFFFQDLQIGSKNRDEMAKSSSSIVVSTRDRTKSTSYTILNIIKSMQKSMKISSFRAIHASSLTAGLFGTRFCYFVLTTLWAREEFMHITMNVRLKDSKSSIDLWNKNWQDLQSMTTRYMRQNDTNTKFRLDQHNPRQQQQYSSEPSVEDQRHHNNYHPSMTSPNTKYFIECIPYHSTESSLWQSQGALRLLLLKRAMDLVYAAVGTANEFTNGDKGNNRGLSSNDINSLSWMPVAAAAASYYAIVGTEKTMAKAKQFVEPSSNTSYPISSALEDEEQSTKQEKKLKESHQDLLLQRAWGMISLPAVKRLSLEVSKLLKGAAFAERISIANVPCFVICSRENFSCTCLKAAHKRFVKQSQVSKLSTIMETEGATFTSTNYHNKERKKNHKPHQHTPRSLDVILHLTAGGFYAHMIAGDLPYLIDWSAHTDAIIICPEYSLLPEFTYPVALNQITDIYCSLRMSEDIVSTLGFQPKSIIVTGESTGGNLAVALCVRLCMIEHKNYFEDTRLKTNSSLSSEVPPCDQNQEENPLSLIKVCLPDALMLCCPTLNLTLNMPNTTTTSDPVLPSGLLTAISDAYLPSSTSRTKKDDPLVSPYFAPDSILKNFPSILIYASSMDPTLDDSVHFHSRLRRLGVKSTLRAVDMPHAYWGLGTAGFPEAQQVQIECMTWLKAQIKDKEQETHDKEQSCE